MSAQKWISVETRLPPMDEMVLLCEKGAIYVGCRSMADEGWLWSQQKYHFDLLDEMGVECDDDYQPDHWKRLKPAGLP